MIGRLSWMLLLPIVLMLGSACAFDEGGGFTTLASGELRAEFEPGSEQVRTDRGYRAQLTALMLYVEEFALLEAGEAEASFSEVVHVHVARDLDLLEGEAIQLTSYEPSAQLGAGTLDRAELLIGRIAVGAVVEGEGLDEPLEIDVTFETDAVIASPMALELSRDVPERISPLVALHAGGALFDGIEFGELAGDAAIVEVRLRQWLETAELEVDLGVVAYADHDHSHEHEAEGHAH